MISRPVTFRLERSHRRQTAESLAPASVATQSIFRPVFGWILSLMLALSHPLTAGELTVSPVLLWAIEEAKVPALEEGAIVEVLVKEGQPVEVGTALVKIDDQQSRFRKEKAEVEYKIATKKALDKSEITLAEIERTVAEAGLQRALDSRKKFPDTPSQAEVDELQLRVAQARQHFDKATHEFQLAELAKELAERSLASASFDHERHTIRSPIKGSVVEIIGRRGDWVRPGEPLLRVMRVDRLRVEGFLPRESVIPGLKDCTVIVTVEGQEGQQESHAGKIVYISTEVDPNDRRQRVLAEIENPKGLLAHGLRGKMTIQTKP